MAMTTAYLNVIAPAGGTAVAYIGLVNAGGTELSGGSPAYARKAVTWTNTNGSIAPTADLTFDIPAAGVVAAWHGYSAATSGTDYGGAALTQETYANQGTYKLLMASTAIQHTAT